MLYYSLKRLLQAIPLLLGIATITFFIVHLAPGDPMDMFLNPQFAKGRGLDADIELALIKKYGLDQPFLLKLETICKAVMKPKTLKSGQ